MKKAIILFFLTILVFPIKVFSWYSSLESFLDSKDSESCIIATDGCNSFVMKNKEFYGSTFLSCSLYTIKWECKSYEETQATKKFVDIDMINKLKKELKTKEKQKEEKLKREYKTNDKEFTLEDKMWKKYFNIWKKFLKKYKKIVSYYPLEKKMLIHDKVLTKIDKKREKIKNKKNISNFKKIRIDSLLEYLYIEIKKLT